MAPTERETIAEESEPSPIPPFRRLGGWVRNYPIPFLAIAGLATGLYLVYLLQLPDLGHDVWLGTLVAGGSPLVYATVRRLLRREFASDVIASLAIVAAIALDQPFAGVIIVLMQSGGEAIEDFAHRMATASLDRLSRRAPRWAYRHAEGGIARVPIAEVQPGDLLAVRKGDLIPVDGTVSSATALIDEATVTGEPLPRTRTQGESVLSGTVNVGPAFNLLAERTSGQSQYARIVELVRNAQTKKPAIQRLADRYATWFTPLTVAIAALAAVLDHSAVTALAVLVVATPCPLILATPIAVLRAVDRAADRGIVAKSGAAMEEIGRAQAVLFDKTGTLTSGQPEVERVLPFAEFPADEVLRLAASIEQISSHPLAEAVVRQAGDQKLSETSNHHEFAGAGVAGTIDGHRMVVGSRKLCATIAHRSLDAEWGTVRQSGIAPGRLISFVLRDGVPIGALVFEDPIRPEVAGLAGKLRALGVREVALLTGDNQENAEDVARRVGITDVEAELSPEEKVHRVGEFRRRYGTTLMVGDGINDAAALATASVGIAMGAHGAGVTAEAADAVLVVDDLGRVPEGIALGQRMLRVARQGILFGLGASLVLMGIASFGYLAPADGAVLQEGLDVAVIFNALRVR
ncbi:MAG: heavy metal translocating P-type ATPase [Thermoplasmata archaeon]|nr:heavy metal translocating P-type ATPase [Thermoplasmata archaeon]